MPHFRFEGAKRAAPRWLFTRRGAIFVWMAAFSVLAVTPNAGSSALAAKRGPDLVIRALSDPPSSVATGARFRVSVVTKNAGRARARASTTRLYLSRDRKNDPADVRLGAGRSVGPLKAGKGARASMNVTVPSTTTETPWLLMACSDDTRKLREANEKNNCRASARSSTVTSGVVSPFSPPSPPFPSSPPSPPSPPPPATLNGPPVNSVPSAQMTNEDAPLVFSSGGGNAIQVSDPDAASAPVQVTLTGDHGLLTLGTTAGLAFSGGDGTADGTLTFTGTLSELNAGLNGLRFDPGSNYAGPAGLTIATNDLGHTGSGGAKSDTDTVAIAVVAINDAPTDVALRNGSVAENQLVGTTAGTLSTTDADADDGHSYSLVSGAGGTDNAAFQIVGSALQTNAVFDFEAKSSYSVRIETNDGHGGTFSKAFAIVVTDNGDGIIGGIHAESSNYVGPFMDGNGNLYTVTEVQAISPNPAMRKSTDGGWTWAEVDAANRPTGSAWFDLESLWIVQDGTKLRMLRQRSGASSNNVSYLEFNTSDAAADADRWVVKEAVVGTASAAPADQACALVVRANGDMYAFYNVTGTNQRVAYKKKPAGGSWGPESYIEVPGKDVQQPVVAAGVIGATDTIHMAVKNDTDNSILYYTLSPSDVLSGPTTLNSTPTTDRERHSLATPAVRLDVGGTKRVFFAWRNGSDNRVVSVTIDDATQQTITDQAAWGDVAIVTNEQPVVSLAADDAADRVHLVYADNATHDIWRDEWNGAWGTDVEHLDGVEAQFVSGNVFTHSAANGGQKVLGIVYDDNPTGALDAGVPKYTQVVRSPPLLSPT